MKSLKILLIGQPNVGKSCLLNALVGSKAIVSNYLGTTVEITQAEKVFNNTKINFVDTPGVYSISDRSEEEKVTEKALFEGNIDRVIIIVDATSLRRSLYMGLQVLEAGLPAVLALNFTEEAEKKGIKIDLEKLKKLLGIPVIPINPLKKIGIEKLLDSLKVGIKKNQGFIVKYGKRMERKIEQINLKLKESKFPKRFLALRILERDKHFFKYLKNEKIIQEVEDNLQKNSKDAEDISITRYGTASFIVGKVARISFLKKEKKLHERIDDFILHKIWGPFITGLFLLAIFGILLYLGNLMQSVLMGLAESFLSSFDGADSIASMVLVQGLTGLAAGVSIALPYVFLFYLILGILEDIGLLSRFIVNAEWFLGKIGLSGKSFIPLALGLGCTAPATCATRVLSSKKEQFRAASLFAFVPCSSRIAIIMGVVGFYGGMRMAISLFAIVFIAGLIWALGIKKIIYIKKEPLLLELPPYRKPLLENVLAKSWIRMKDFVYIVMPLLIIGGMAYEILNITGITDIVIGPFSSITAWLGLPAVVIIPLIFGFLQKDLTGAMLISVLGSEISLVLSSLQIFTFGIASTIGIPCVIALGMLIREFGFKKAISLTTASIIYGILFAGLAWRIISLF